VPDQESQAGSLRPDRVAALLAALVLLGIPCLIGCLP
jgi:hypothetical protein